MFSTASAGIKPGPLSAKCRLMHAKEVKLSLIHLPNRKTKMFQPFKQYYFVANHAWANIFFKITHGNREDRPGL